MVDSAADVESGRLGNALVELETEGVAYGDLALTIALHGDLAQTERLDGDVLRIFAAHDAKVIREGYGQLPAWFCRLPAQPRKRQVRSVFVSAGAAACLAPIYGPPTGSPRSRHLDRAALAILETQWQTPFSLRPVSRRRRPHTGPRGDRRGQELHAQFLARPSPAVQPARPHPRPRGLVPLDHPVPRGRLPGAVPRRRDRAGRLSVAAVCAAPHRADARHMRDALPNASFIGFTGTPIELADASTRAVFGDHISVYDIQRAVEDGATVPIYYESRLAKLVLDEDERPTIDAGFEEVTEGEEVDRREKLKTKWAQLEAIVGAERRVALVARDIVEHFDSRQEAMDGKAMVVCMSRRICIDLYGELVRLRPEWRDDDDSRGALKVVMTGKASDPPDWQQHIGNKARREGLAKRFRDPADPLRMVLVRDMWLTGFDAPSLHTMYVDKPMRGHGLMQAIARVNRVFRDKPGGLGCRLPRSRPRAEAGASDLHRERRQGPDRPGQGAGGPGDAGEVRGLLRPVPRLRPVRMDDRLAGRAAPPAAGGRVDQGVVADPGPPQIRTCGFCRIRLLDRWLRYAPSRTRWSRKPGDGHRHPQGLSGQFGYPLS